MWKRQQSWPELGIELLRADGPRAEARVRLNEALAAGSAIPPAGAISVAPSGKPYIEGGPSFSLAHADGFSILAVSSRYEVGLDVEKVVPIAEIDAIAAEHFSDEARAAIHSTSGEAKVRAFYGAWTDLEARIKARGQQLAAHEVLDAIVTIRIDLGTAYSASLAFELKNSQSP